MSFNFADVFGKYRLMTEYKWRKEFRKERIFELRFEYDRFVLLFCSINLNRDGNQTIFGRLRQNLSGKYFPV